MFESTAGKLGYGVVLPIRVVVGISPMVATVGAIGGLMATRWSSHGVPELWFKELLGSSWTFLRLDAPMSEAALWFNDQI